MTKNENDIINKSITMLRELGIERKKYIVENDYGSSWDQGNIAQGIIQLATKLTDFSNEDFWNEFYDAFNS